VVIARLLLLRKAADTVRLKIIVSSLNLIPTPAPDKIFNAHPLDFFNANFYVPEMYCFAAWQLAILCFCSETRYSVARQVVIRRHCYFEFLRAGCVKIIVPLLNVSM